MLPSQPFNILMKVLPVIAWAVLTVLVIALVFFIVQKIVQLRYLVTRKEMVLELTPPARGDRTPEATGQLFMGIASLQSARKFSHRLFGIYDPVTLEIVSTRGGGIRYLIFCNERHAKTIEHMVASYVTDAKVKYIDEYKRPDSGVSKIYEFSQNVHFAFPLKSFNYLEEHDPISYITNAMTKLDNNELMSFQLVVQPVKNREIDTLVKQLLSNADMKPKLAKKTSKGGVLLWIGQQISKLLFGITDIISGAHSTYNRNFNYESHYVKGREIEYQSQVARGLKPVRQLSYFEHQLMDGIHKKLAQPIFTTDIRMLVSVKDKAELLTRRRNMEAALGLYGVPEYQSLVMRTAKHYLLQRYASWSFRKRLPSLFIRHRSMLGALELASLYHFPNTIVAKTENVIKSLSKTLPAPVSLKGGRKLDVLIGINKHHGIETPIGLTNNERERHMYVIGGTGNGKTTLLKYQIVQDIQQGNGLAIVDPHGDLAEELLGYIPEDRIKDVIYINPDDLSYPVGINLLELPENISGDDLLREKDLVTESTVSVLRKIFSEDDSGGHRIEYVLRNTIQTALTMENANLFTIFRLLNDSKFRIPIVNKLQDEDLKIFWKNELGKAGEMQKVKMAAGITAKIGRFLFSASARRILEQDKSSINFDTAMDEKKIIICNFSKGLLGEDTSMLFGVTILAKLQLSALRRARVSQSKRVPYYLYVDEFQNFATMSFVQMLSEARKYKVFLTMAEQSTQQQVEQRLVDIVLANVGTVIAFRSGSPADERLILPLFKPYIHEGELSNLPAYNFYCRISAIDAQEPMSGETVLLDAVPNLDRANSVKEESRRTYGREIKEEKVKDTQPERKTEIQKAKSKRSYKKKRSDGIGTMTILNTPTNAQQESLID